jgi:hypothetical protein
MIIIISEFLFTFPLGKIAKMRRKNIVMSTNNVGLDIDGFENERDGVQVEGKKKGFINI